MLYGICMCAFVYADVLFSNGMINIYVANSPVTILLSLIYLYSYVCVN